MIPLRRAARAVLVAILVAGMLIALAVAIFSIGADDNTISLPKLADYAHLPELRDTAGNWLAHLEADGGTAWWSVLAGAIVLVAGLLLLVGRVFPHRYRVVVMEDDPTGRLASRPHALARVARSLAEHEQGVVDARARVRPRRFWPSSLNMVVIRPKSASASDVEGRAGDAVEPITEAFKLETRIRSRLGPRVE